MGTAKLNSLGHQSQQLLHFPVSKALSSATKPRELHKIHSLLIVSGLDKSVFFSGKLISKYAQFKEPLACLSIFRQISPTRNVYQWNTTIRAMTHNGFYSDALNFYSQMGKLNIQPDTYTFPSVINACAGLLDFQMGNLAHDHVVEMGFGSDLYIGNAFIDMYARFNELSRARNMFDEMPHKDIVSWNSLISGYCSNGFWKEALEIFQQSRMVGMLPDFVTVSSVLPACASLVAVDDGEVVHGFVEKSGMKADMVVNNGLLSMYFKFGRLADCYRIFDEMVGRDTVTWNIMIYGYSESGLYEDSIKLFQGMLSKFEPDLLTITSVLRACSHIEGEYCYISKLFAFWES